MKCTQICPYNTLKGCNVVEMNQVCPMSNVKTKLFENPEQLVKTKDVLFRRKKKYEVVIAERYHSAAWHTEIYANQSSINTLWELGFDTIKRSDTE